VPFCRVLCVLQACEEFKSISRKLLDKPNTIEELSELREWSKNIPEKVAQQQVETASLVKNIQGIVVTR